ncbi:MAG: cell envelope integrity protein TolA, partial [Treponema sp.]|nr:cell envelope integrity protein TolA [Treponema sp.]
GGGDKSCSVYFFDFELEYKSEWSENFPEGDAKKRMEKALQSRKQYAFNLLTTLKKLCKGHEKESISITIPVGAKMWNERDMMALLEYFYNDTSLAQKYVKDFIMPVISKKQPVVLELYVYGGKLSYASFRTQSVAAQIDVEKEIAANEKAGFGRLTNAEVEKERKQNEAAGRGRLTNAEILSAERDANKKAGLGNLTNAEVEAERSANESAGNGRLTNAELAKKQDEERAANEKAGRGKLTNAEVEKERKANEAAGRGRLTNAEIRTKNKQLFMQKVPKWIANSKISGSEVTISDWFCSPKPTTTVVINYSSNELLLSHEVVTNGFVVFKVDITFRLAKQGDAGNCYISRIYMQNTTTYETQTFVCNGPNDYGNTMEIIGAMSQLLPLMYEF